MIRINSEKEQEIIVLQSVCVCNSHLYLWVCVYIHNSHVYPCVCIYSTPIAICVYIHKYTRYSHFSLPGSALFFRLGPGLPLLKGEAPQLHYSKPGSLASAPLFLTSAPAAGLKGPCWRLPLLGAMQPADVCSNTGQTFQNQASSISQLEYSV